MIILAIDTAAHNCSVALLRNGQILGHDVKNIGKGHAEVLTKQIDALCHLVDISLQNVDKIAVNIGPGSFTGVRVGVATVRALSLALNIPAIGISALEAIAYEAQYVDNKPLMVVMDAGRDLIYRQDFLENHLPITAPIVQSQQEFIQSYQQEFHIAGPFAEILAEKIQFDTSKIVKTTIADVISLAQLAANKIVEGRPKPLYLRDADAKPQQNFALARK